MNKHHASKPKLPATIVVGVDAAGLSDHAVRQGLDLGRQLSARVRLVHAVPTPPDVWPGIDPARSMALTEELLAGAHRAVNEHVRTVVRGTDPEKVQTKGAGARATAVLDAPPGEDPVHVIPGPPAKVLLDQAHEKRGDWILLGGHTKRGFLDFGSTMRAVFAKATVPVWVQAQPFRPIERILAPVDSSEDSLGALGMASALAKVLHARVHVLHCFELGTYAVAGAVDHAGYGATFPYEEVRRAEQDRLDAAMRDFDWGEVEHTSEFVEGVPSDEILNRSAAADLIVMGTHGRTGLASVVLGGTAYSVLKRSEKPVLVARHGKREFLI